MVTEIPTAVDTAPQQEPVKKVSKSKQRMKLIARLVQENTDKKTKMMNPRDVIRAIESIDDIDVHEKVMLAWTFGHGVGYQTGMIVKQIEREESSYYYA